MTTESIFIVARKLEAPDANYTLYERESMRDVIRMTIQRVLERWADSVSKEKRALYRNRIERPIEYIKTRRFQVEFVWTNAKEVVVKYITNGIADMYISITPKLILVKDYEFGMKEAAFPI